MPKFKLLIIGGGISAINTYQLALRYAIEPLIVDDNAIGASHVAAGMINPITGRNLLKTWLCDHIFPFAHAYYSDCESFYKKKFFYHLPIYHLFRDKMEENDVFAKSADPDYTHLINTDKELKKHLPPFLKENSKGAIFQQGGFVDINSLLESVKLYAKKKKQYQNDTFDWNELKVNNSGVEYKNKFYDAVLDCTGVKVSNNPYFAELPVIASKGEILGLKGVLTHYPHYLYHKQIFIFKHPDGLLRAGSTYNKTDKSNQNTEEAAKYLLEKANAIMPDSYKVEKHWYGFRPTTIDRRPIVGHHPDNKKIYILNGMGSKGATLSPFFAYHLLRNILFKSPLNEIIKPDRFFYKK